MGQYVPLAAENDKVDNRKMGRLRFIAVFAAFAAFPAFGQSQNTTATDTTIAPFQFVSPRANGMGGVHAAFADDFGTIFVNPAGISTVEDQFSLAAVNVTLNDINTMLRLLSSGFSDTAVYADKFQNHLEARFDIGGPLAIGYIKKDFGLGLMNHQFLKAWWDRNDIFVINANVVEEVAFYAGQSFPISNFEKTMTFSLGYMLKPAMRLVFAPRDIQLIEFRYILQNLQKEPFQTHLGLGLDTGFLLSFSDTVYFAGVCRDIVSPVLVSRYANFAEFVNGIRPVGTSTEWIKPTYDFSICFRTKNTIIYEVVEDIVFTVDYHGLGNLLENIDRNPLLDIGAGIELRLLRAFWLRIGWQQMLPGGGFGIDLGWAKLDAAVFGETFGSQPGDFQSVSFSLGLSFRY
jgi:hypothetical protein